MVYSCSALLVMRQLQGQLGEALIILKRIETSNPSEINSRFLSLEIRPSLAEVQDSSVPAVDKPKPGFARPKKPARKLGTAG